MFISNIDKYDHASDKVNSTMLKDYENTWKIYMYKLFQLYTTLSIEHICFFSYVFS